MRLLFLCLGFLAVSLHTRAQDVCFYIRTVSENIEIPTTAKDSVVRYTGTDSRIKKVFDKYDVKVFRKEFKYADRDKLKRTYFGIASSSAFSQALVKTAPDVFEFQEVFTHEDLKMYEPNDYGLTSTTGKNTGAQAFLDYYDFLGVPQAWYYTTGSRDIAIGISDGYVNPNDPEFKGKLKMFKKSGYADGHGYSVAATAAAQGDNGYGIAGVCYDCSVYTTTYGDFRELKQLLELSRAGAKVINCSWGSTRYYETAQEVINEMRDNGTIIVSVSHNKSLKVTNGGKPYYPGAYKHAITVGSIQHRNASIQEGRSIHEESGTHLSENVAYMVAQKGKFEKNNPVDQNYLLYDRHTNNLDPSVDILAPGSFIFRYGHFESEGTVTYNPFTATSPAAPLVSGTIGLMFSLNPCLSVDEVNSIVKLTSTNIDHIEANAPFRGMYGSGALHTGRAVKMVYDMMTPSEFVTIENQDFSRWDFTLDAPYNIVMRSQRFRESATASFTAKNQILIQEETLLLPAENGSIHLKIDPKATYTCKEN